MSGAEDTLISILTEMYEESNHIAGDKNVDFADVYRNPEEFDNDFYQRHILEKEEQERIIEKHLDSGNLSKRERVAIRTECMCLAPKIPEKSE